MAEQKLPPRESVAPDGTRTPIIDEEEPSTEDGPQTEQEVNDGASD